MRTSMNRADTPDHETARRPRRLFAMALIAAAVVGLTLATPPAVEAVKRARIEPAIVAVKVWEISAREVRLKIDGQVVDTVTIGPEKTHTWDDLMPAGNCKPEEKQRVVIEARYSLRNAEWHTAAKLDLVWTPYNGGDNCRTTIDVKDETVAPWLEVADQAPANRSYLFTLKDSFQE